MNTHTPSYAEIASMPKNLHQLVSLAAKNARINATQRHSFIINEVVPGFQIATDEALLTSVLNQLLSTVVNNTNHCCIKVEAKEYDDVIFISVKDNSVFSNLPKAENLEHVKLLARKLNGNLSIAKLGNNSNSILLSFPNFPIAA
jgi:hypothetical protein